MLGGQCDRIGYSFGADALPLIASNLPTNLRSQLRSLILISPGENASFELHVAGWLPGDKSADPSVAAALKRIEDIPVLCLYGDADQTALCPRLSGSNIVVQKIGEGHHLGNEQTIIAHRIRDFSQSKP